MTNAVRSALTVSEAFSALGNDQFETEGATFVRNREIPDIWDANHVAHVTAATTEEIDRLLARVEREFEGCNHRQFRVEFTTPPALEARLTLEGYERPLGPLMTHVVNHGTHHRAETAMALTALGKPPRQLDYLYFELERA